MLSLSNLTIEELMMVSMLNTKVRKMKNHEPQITLKKLDQTYMILAIISKIW